MSLPDTDKITVAVITGGHAFNVPAFHNLFRGLDEVDAYIQPMEDFVADVGAARDRYDVLVFYNMHREIPAAGAKGYEARLRMALEQLGQTPQGIFLLHHAILAYIGWPLWSNLVGIPDRTLSSYHHGERLRVHIANGAHPITRGLEPWEMVDETYVMDEPQEGSDILLTVDHPRSMSSIAWTRTLGPARVFCFEAGHDNETYVNPSFRTVVSRGIQWCARRI